MHTMIRVAYFGLFLVVVAGLTHIGSLLAIPTIAERDAWAKLSAIGGKWTFVPVASPQRTTPPVFHVDPAMEVAACRFDLREGGVRLTADGKLPFWSVSIYDRRGQNVYSFNDRTAVDRQLFVIVVDEVQMAKLRTNLPEDNEQAVLIEAPIEEGFVLVRALQQDATWRDEVKTFMQSARCEQIYIAPEENDGENS